MQERWFPITASAVIFLLSLGGAAILFGLLNSYATIRGTGWEAGGAVAGFLIIFWSMHRMLRIFYRPVLTSLQTLTLVQLFQEASKGKIIRAVFKWIDDIESGHPLPSREDRLKAIIGVRHTSCELLTGFFTPLPDIQKVVEELLCTPDFEEDFHQAMDLVESDLSAPLKRERLAGIVDRVGEDRRTRFLEKLKEKGWN